MNKMKIPESDRIYAQQSAGFMVQLAVQLAREKDVPKVISNFKKMFMGLRMGTDGEYLYPRRYDDKMHRLPFHLTNCQDALDYAYETFMPDWNDSMAYLAVGENNIISVTSNHLLADNNFMINALKHCVDDKLDTAPMFPKHILDAYKEPIEDIKKRNIQAPEKSDITKIYSDLRKTPSKDYKHTNVITLEFPTQTLLKYDKATNRCGDLTFALASAFAVSTMALTRLQTKFGVRNLIDLRKFLKPDEFDMSCVNHNVCVDLDAPNIRLSNTIEDLNQAFQQIMEFHMKKGGVFSSLKGDLVTSSKSDNITTCCLSNLGAIPFKRQIKDFAIQSRMKSDQMPDSVLLVTYSKIQGDLNTMVLRLAHNQSVIAPKDGERFAKSIVYALQNLQPTTVLADAVNKIRRFNNFI